MPKLLLLSLLLSLTILLISHAQNDFRSSIIPSDDVRRHHERLNSRPCQSKVQNLECTITSDDDIRGFQVPVDYSSTVKMSDAAEHLVEQIGESLVVQIHLDHLAKVRIHQFHYDVEVIELVKAFLRSEAVEDSDYLKVCKDQNVRNYKGSP